MRRHIKKVALYALAAGVAAWLVMRAISWGSCSIYGYQTDRETRYAAFVGCMVRIKGSWVPRHELRVTQ